MGAEYRPLPVTLGWLSLYAGLSLAVNETFNDALFSYAPTQRAITQPSLSGDAAATLAVTFRVAVSLAAKPEEAARARAAAAMARMEVFM